MIRIKQRKNKLIRWILLFQSENFDTFHEIITSELKSNFQINQWANTMIYFDENSMN